MVKAYEPLYTVKEAAKVLKVNVSAVYRLINTLLPLFSPPTSTASQYCFLICISL